MLNARSLGLSTGRRLPKRVKRFAEITSLHGMRDLFLADESKLVKSCWALVIIVTTGLLIYEVSQLSQTYFKEPIATNIQFQKMTRNELAEIITPYLCIKEWMSKSKASQSGYTEEQLRALYAFSNNDMGTLVETPGSPERYKMERNWIKTYQHQTMNGQQTLHDYYKNLTKDFPFLRGKTSRKQDDFIVFIDALCFPINLTSGTDVVGVPIYRAKVDLLVNDTKHFHGKNWRSRNPNEASLIFYHGRNMRYLSEIDRLATNFTIHSEPQQLNLRMKFRRLKHLIRRNTACEKFQQEEEGSKYPVNYNRQLCMQKCMDNSLYRAKYNCTFQKPRSNHQTNLSYAALETQYPLCTADKFFFHKNYSSADTLRVKMCQDECDTLDMFCDEWDIVVERQRWVPAQSCAGTRGCFNLAIVAQPTVEIIDEVLLMNLDTLLSNLGGQAGLWFGGSVLSIIQMVIFCFLYGTCNGLRHQSFAYKDSTKMHRKRSLSMLRRLAASKSETMSKTPEISVDMALV